MYLCHKSVRIYYGRNFLCIHLLPLEKIEGRRRRGNRGKMVGWHHWLNGHEFQQTPGDGEGQGSLACCSPWGRTESDTTEQLNKNNLSLCFFGTRKKYTLVSVKQHYSLRKGWITREEWIREDITLLLSLSSPGAMKAKSPLPKRRKLNTMCSSFKTISTPFHLLWQKKKRESERQHFWAFLCNY